MKITNVLVQSKGNEYDRECLSRACFNVNMRLYHVNVEYRKIITSIIDYMYLVLDTNFEDYPQETGVASSTLGIPFNIIAYKNKEIKKAMINPEIVERSLTKSTGKSNCGCCRLKNKIEIFRYDWISVRYYDRFGNLSADERLTKMEGGFTVQHEIDHNIGYTIVDRFIQQGGKESVIEYPD